MPRPTPRCGSTWSTASPGPTTSSRDYQHAGRIDLDLLRRSLPHGRHQFYVCGPPPMVRAVCGDKAQDKSQGPLDGHLKAMGYDATMVFKF